MLDPHREIQALIDNFVDDMSELARRIAIEQLKIAFGVGAKLVVPPMKFATPTMKLAPGKFAAPAAARTTRARRGQREIEALRGKLLAAIAEQPGRRAEDINAALGTRTAQIAQPLRKLVAERLVRTEGARRGTRYFAVTPEVHNGRRAPSESAVATEESPS